MFRKSAINRNFTINHEKPILKKKDNKISKHEVYNFRWKRKNNKRKKSDRFRILSSIKLVHRYWYNIDFIYQ